MDTNLKIAKENRKAIQAKAQSDLLKSLLTNPVFELVTAYVIIEMLQREGVIPEMAGNVAEGACVGAVIWQQLAPSMPYIAQVSSEGIKAMTGALSGGMQGIAGLLPLGGL